LVYYTIYKRMLNTICKRMPNQLRSIGGARRATTLDESDFVLNVKQEGYDVPILDNVILALKPE